jgi:predicted ATPase/DNA-binding SARP family transcriptional activator
VGSTEFRLLGPLEVAVDGQRADIGGAKQRALLAELLLRANDAVARDALVDAVWGDDPPVSAVGSLQVYVHGLRKALGADRIETDGGAYRIRVAAGELDVDRFRGSIAEARAARRPADAAAALDAALALWRGDALADLPGHVAARALEEQRLEALELRNDAWLDLGRHDLVLPLLEPLIAAEPYRERLRSQQILALYRAGRQADALAAYRAARAVWREELGVEPTPALRELERAVLRHDPSLSLPQRSSPEARLPAPATPLVGRHLEIAAAAALLRGDTRLLTLVGPGGTGKTRLALAVAGELASELADGAVFVDLSAVSDAELVLPAVEETAGDDLRTRALLLVLDNFEQVLGAGPHISELLASAPDLRVLVTSRAPLRLASERVYPVPPLPLPRPTATHLAELEQNDAVRLFVDRAHAADPSFALGADNAPAVARICRFLDGLPLAIELAAARARLLSPAELADRLEQRPDALGPGPRDVPARHATLVATIEWSHDLLGADEQAAFARLGVFAGGCTLEAAERVCGISIDELASLVDNSLVQRRRSPGGPRFVMLETVRRFALDRLHGDGVRERHVEWLLDLATAAHTEVLSGGDTVTWLDRMEAEHDNLRAALGWALETGRVEIALQLAAAARSFWEFRGHLAEGGRWLDDLLAADPGVPVDVRAKAAGVAASLAFHRGEFDRARELHSELLELARARGDAAGVARGLSDLGSVDAAVGDLERAAELLQQSVDAFRALGEDTRAALALCNLGHVAQQQGDYERAVAVTLDALAIQRAHGDRLRAVVSLYNLGSYAMERGDLVEVRRWLGECFPVALELGYREVIAYGLAALVSLAVTEGDDARGAELAGAVDELLAQTGVGLIPATAARFEAAKETLRTTLGEDGFAPVYARGRTLTVEEALDRAGFAVATR